MASNKGGKSVWLASDVLNWININSQHGERLNDTLRRMLDVPKKYRPARPKAVKKTRAGKHGRPFKYDVTDLDVGESKTLYDVHPEMALPCIHRYGRTRGKIFICQGAPGCITVTRVK